MSKFGVAPQRDLVISGVNSPEPAAAAFEALLTTANAPTAILGLNRGISIGVVKSLLRSNFSLSFIGVDDFELADGLSVNVIDRKPHELGRRAAELAVQRITEPNASTTQLSIAPDLNIRSALR